MLGYYAICWHKIPHNKKERRKKKKKIVNQIKKNVIL